MSGALLTHDADVHLRELITSLRLSNHVAHLTHTQLLFKKVQKLTYNQRKTKTTLKCHFRNVPPWQKSKRLMPRSGQCGHSDSVGAVTVYTRARRTRFAQPSPPLVEPSGKRVLECMPSFPGRLPLLCIVKFFSLFSFPLTQTCSTC